MYAGAVRRAAQFLRSTPLHPQWLLEKREDAASWVAGIASGRVLDVGCADRWIEKRLPPSAAYIGLDYPITGKQIYGARPDVFADASQLPFADASIDTVVMLEVLEHLRAPYAALREINRVLVPGGRALVSMPFLYPVHDAPHDYQRLTVHGLTRDVQDAGLRIDALTPTLGSAETAGLIACLAIGGMALRAVQQRSLAVLLLPLLCLAIPLTNLLAWLAGRLLPSWDAITNGYRVTATKPLSPAAGP